MNDVLMIIILATIATVFIAIYFVINKPSNKEWKKKTILKLEELDQLVNSNDIHRMRNSLLEADKLLDYTFKHSKFKGETMGERLKSVQKYYKWEEYQKIWEAHKLRNKLAHEIDFTPKTTELQSAYKTLKKAIQRFV